MRQGDVVHFLHTDHLGSTTLVTDQAGAEVGRAQYDPYGNVISSTLPAVLAETLAGHLDPATGLQYHGDRYYDAWIGGYVQPNPFGGVPGGARTSTPYTEDSAVRFDLALVLSVSINKTLGYYGNLTRYISTYQFSGWQRRRIAQPFWQFSSRPAHWVELRTEAAPATLRRLGLLDYFEPDLNVPKPGGNRTAFIARELVEQAGSDLYRTETGEIIDIAAALNLSTRRWLRSPSFTPGQIPTRNAYYRTILAPAWRELSPLAKFGLKNGLPFGIDAAWQLYDDWDINMPVGHRLGRAGVAAGVGLVTGAIVEGGLFLLLGTSPSGWAVIGVSVIVGLTLEPTVRDIVYDVTHLKVD